MVPAKGLNISHRKTKSCGTPEEDRSALGAMNRQRCFEAFPSASAKFLKCCYFFLTQFSE